MPLPTGAWPVMLTPFDDDLVIDWGCLDAYTDWLIELGAAGLFTVALSSEMYELEPEQRVQLAERVVRRAGGRVPVVASAVGQNPREIADAGARLADVGVDAVVLISSLLTEPGEADDRLLDAVADVTGSIDSTVSLGLYECPVPYRRLLSDRELEALASSGRFVFLKDTSQDPALMARRISSSSSTPLRHFNAQIATLLETLRSGGHGFSGFAANVYPDLVAWLCAEHAVASQADVLATQRLLTIAELAFGAGYPASAKYLVRRRSGIPMGTVGRWRPATVSDAHARALDDLVALLDSAGLPGLRG